SRVPKHRTLCVSVARPRTFLVLLATCLSRFESSGTSEEAVPPVTYPLPSRLVDPIPCSEVFPPAVAHWRTEMTTKSDRRTAIVGAFRTPFSVHQIDGRSAFSVLTCRYSCEAIV